MDAEREQWRFKAGDEVRTGDDHKLGKVVGCWPPDAAAPTHLLVEGGFLVHHTYYVPTASVAAYDGSRAFVDAAKGEVDARGWQAPPSGAATAAADLGQRA